MSSMNARFVTHCIVYGLLWLGTWESMARLDDWWVAGASPWRPYSIDILFRPSAFGREGVPNARFGKWQMNALGFRGDPVVSGRESVLAYGASETFGQYESPEHEYPRLLQKELAAKLQVPIQVVNAAMPGLRIGRIQYLEHALKLVQPRYVVMYPSPANYIGTDTPFCQRPAVPIPSGPSLLSHVRMAEKVERLVKRSLPPAVMNGLRAAVLWLNTRGIVVLDRVPDATIQAFAIDLDCAMDSILAQNAVPIFVTHATYFGSELRAEDATVMLAWRRFYPDLAESGFLDLERRANATIREKARRRGALLFDAAAEIPAGPHYFADFVHFTDSGAQAMARGIAQVIALHETQ